MIIRSGIRSILRSKKLCSLFFLLTVLLSCLLSLGTGIYGAAAATLASFEETYRTVGRIEYIGADYPDETVYDPAAASAYESLDLDSIRSLEGVISAEKKQYMPGYTDSFTRWRGPMPYRNNAVLIMTRLHPSAAELTDIPLAEEPILDDVCMITNTVTREVTLMYYGEAQTLPFYSYDRSSRNYIQTVFEDGSYVRRQLSLDELADEYVMQESENKALRFVYRGMVPVEDKTLPRYACNPVDGSWYKQEEIVSEYTGILSDYLYSGKTDKRILIRLKTGAFPFEPDETKTYIVNGSFVDAETSNLVFEIRQFEGSDSPPFMEINSMDTDELNATVFGQYADHYRFANNYLNVTFSDDISLLEPFHQGWLVLAEGRFPSAGEEHACVIDRSLADRASLKTGDALPLRLLTPSETDLWEYVRTGEEELYTITGITAENNDYSGEVFIQGSAPADTPFFGCQLGMILFENKTARTAAETIRLTLGPQVRLTLYDQGYETNSQPLSALKTAALMITMLSAAIAMAVVILFAYLYIYRQQETIETLRRLGLKNRDTAVWMLAGFLTVTLAGSLAGTAAGSLLLKWVLSLTVAGTSSLYAMDTRFSEAAVGLTKAVETVMPASFAVSLLCIAAILLAACLLGLFFLRLAMRGTVPARGKIRLKVPEDTTSTRGDGIVRYGRIGFERGGSRSTAVILITFTLSLLLCGFSAMKDSWQEELDELYDNTVIPGSVVSLNGRYSSDLIIPESTVRQFNTCGFLSEFHVSYGTLHYWLEEEIPAFADTSFGQETKNAWIRKQPKMILTDSLDAAEDFFFTPAVIEWLDGFDENFFSGERKLMNEYRQLDPATGRVYMTQSVEALVPDTWMERHGLGLGEETEIIVSDMPVLIRIVGAFSADASKENIYLPLNAAFETKYLYEEHPGFSGYASMHENTFTTGRFRLKSARQLAGFKDFLSQNQFSQVNRPARNRTTILINDAAFLDTLSTLERHIAFASMITPVLMAFTILGGFLISWLIINGRRMDFAVMKGLGTGRLKVFMIFFMEQAYGAAIGILPCLILSFFIADPLIILLFAAAYLSGTALSIILAGRENLMVLLAEKE